MRAGLQPAQGAEHEVGSDCGQSRRYSFGGVFGLDRDLLLQKYVSGVEAGIDAHGGDARRGFSLGNRPLDGRRAPVLGQE